MKKKPILDLHRIPEEERIRMIAAQLLAGKTVGVIVDNEPGKPQRYLRKIRKRCPAVVVDREGEGPSAGAYFMALSMPNPASN